MNSTIQNLCLYGLTVLIWGSTWYAITFQIGHVHPLLSISYRFFIAAVAIFLFLACAKRLENMRFTRRQHGFLALQGLFLFCANYGLFYLATFYLASGLVAVVFSVMPLMNIINQAIIFKINVKARVVYGSLIGIAGIALVFWPEIEKLHWGDASFIGLGLCLLATYSASLGNMAAMRNARDKIPVIEGNCVGMFYGAVLSFVSAIFMGASIQFSMDTGYIVSLLYLAFFGSAVAFAAYLTLVQRIGADRAAYTTVLFPIVALLISTVFEGFIWTWPALCGVCLTVAGNVMAMAGDKGQRLNFLEKLRKNIHNQQVIEK